MKNRILRSALSVALCAAMLLSQGLTAFADGEIVSRALETSPEYIQEMFQGPLKQFPHQQRRSTPVTTASLHTTQPTVRIAIFCFSSVILLFVFLKL